MKFPNRKDMDMARVTVYGASDDLVELEGDIREEFGYRDEDEGDLVAFSDGTVLRIRRDGMGFWRIVPVARGSAEMTVVQATDADEDYSDRVTLDGDVRWAVHGSGYANSK